MSSVRFALIVLMLFSLNAFSQAGKQTAPAISLYLTFDDGPTEISHFLDSIVIKDSIPLSVFLVGFRAGASEAMRQRVENYRQDTAFDTGNHSYSHASGHYKLYYNDQGEVVNDIIRNADSLKLANHIVRLPGRNTWRIGGRKRTDLMDANPAADSLTTLGYSLIGWDAEWKVDTCENRYSTADEMISMVNQLVHSKRIFEKGHVVILCHDWSLVDPFFREELHAFISRIRKDGGMKFSRLGAYPGLLRTDDILTRRPDRRTDPLY